MRGSETVCVPGLTRQREGGGSGGGGGGGRVNNSCQWPSWFWPSQLLLLSILGSTGSF